MDALHSSYVATREALHAVAEHVLGAAMHDAISRIGLRAHPGGFATQEFGGRVVAVESGVLVDGDRSLPLDGATLHAAAAFVGIEPHAPAVYTPTTPADYHTPLRVHEPSALAIGDWFTFVNNALTALTADAEGASEIQIWPEHFDIACDLGDAASNQRANYGGSPGDAANPQPYLYVGPWDVDTARGKHPEFFTDSWGAALHYKELLTSTDAFTAALTFLRVGSDAVQRGE